MITGNIQIHLEHTDKGLGDLPREKTNVLQLGGKKVAGQRGVKLNDRAIARDTDRGGETHKQLSRCAIALSLCTNKPELLSSAKGLFQ